MSGNTPRMVDRGSNNTFVVTAEAAEDDEMPNVAVVHTADCRHAVHLLPNKITRVVDVVHNRGGRFCTDCDAADEFDRWSSYEGGDT